MKNLVQWLKRLYIVIFPFFVAYLWRLLLFKLFAGNIDLDPLFDVLLYMDKENRVDLDLELRLGPPPVPPRADEGDIVPKIDFDSLPFQWIWDHEHSIGNLIRELRNEEHLRQPAPEQVEQIVSMLQKRNGGVEKLPRILQEMQENRLQSLYYNESKNIDSQLISKPKPR